MRGNKPCFKHQQASTASQGVATFFMGVQSAPLLSSTSWAEPGSSCLRVHSPIPPGIFLILLISALGCFAWQTELSGEAHHVSDARAMASRSGAAPSIQAPDGLLLS